MVEANGGKIIDEMLVPQNTRDFSSYLLKVQQIKPDVVAAAVGGDDIKALRQQVIAGSGWTSAGVDQQPAGLARRLWARPGGDVRCVRHDLVLPARPAGRQGIRRRVPEGIPGHGDPVPGNVYYNGYMATRELLRACERAGTTNNIAVIKQLEA